MKITEILKQRDKGVSFEFFPPKTEAGKRSLETTVKALKKYNPLYVSMTYGAAGGAQQRTKEAVIMLLKEKELVVMPHLTGICLEKKEVKNLLDEYRSKGIENIMALRGDPPLDEEGFDFSKQEFCYGLDLVKFIKQYGQFCIGVAVYPEGHIETSSLEEDLEYTKQKIDAGADFAVTQMFFDNTHYYGLLERMNKKGITIPVLPGILPLTDVAKVKQFVSICRTTIPKHIEEKMERYRKDLAEMEKIGVDFTIKQCQDLIKNGAKQLHFFTLNKPEVMKRILDAIQ
ncbi:MAG: methylenetetrahydrofolate reductase [NAD(P)H] [Candidatus Omnitrophota bacterium]|nr:MAG: methylenetetrahydrofolate reductase [NAD(P)H] [Candidatus Omnitrophota bacterium]